MKSTHLYLLIFITLSLFSCKDDEPIARPSIYTGCCDNDPVEYVNNTAFSTISMYIPSAFTPNGDGVNDLLEIVTINVDFIGSFEIRDQQDRVVFSKNNFSTYFESLTWDGKINHFGNDAIVGGLYNYSIEFFTNYGINETVEGTVCAFLCDENFPEDKDDCLFRTQLGADGFDSSIGAQEGNCFN